jgi:hypothetical protein
MPLDAREGALDKTPAISPSQKSSARALMACMPAEISRALTIALRHAAADLKYFDIKPGMSWAADAVGPVSEREVPKKISPKMPHHLRYDDGITTRTLL